jgi:hypothetical protein
VARSYRDWERDARTTTKSVTRLGNELRDHWDVWKKDPQCKYESLDECLRGELGITAEALRLRNYRARRNATVSTGNGNEVPQPVRQVPSISRPEERARRAPITAHLWQEGYAREAISKALGISPTVIREDLIAEGTPRAYRVAVRHEVPEGDFRWRNHDVDNPTADVSIILEPSFAACETPSAAEAIQDVRNQLALILGGRYHLSLKDRNQLIKVLEEALQEARNGKTSDSRQSTRVVG